MCGIVGYVGNGSAKKAVIEGLRSLEYRGYDSAGIALLRGGRIAIKKEPGKLDNLVKRLGATGFDSSIGMGHTRWATHGAPTKTNAHPHLSMDGRIAIIHNGIVENYMKIREQLAGKHGIRFLSETDSEGIAQLISIYYKGDLVSAVQKATKKLQGAYAIVAMASDNPDLLVAARNGPPLIAGRNDEVGLIASDIPAILKYTRDICVIEDGEFVACSKGDIKVYDKDLHIVKRGPIHIDWDVSAAEKNGYAHFMLKEIFEQPKGVKDTLDRCIDKKGNIVFENIKFTKDELNEIDRIYIIACGTASHAGLIGKSIIEKFTGIPCEVEIASEFRYSGPIVTARTLTIAISQSGETADTLEALKEARRRGSKILSIVNVVGSSIARMSDNILYTWAGPEIAVASTKAYTTQLAALYLIALYMGKVKGKTRDADIKRVIGELRTVPEKIEQALKKHGEIEALARQYYRTEKIFFVGRGLDVPTASEASLKLKEITYINSFAIAAGELKHGTISLMTPSTVVFALASQKSLYDKMVSNMQEIKARGARVVAISAAGRPSAKEVADEVFYLPNVCDEVAPLVAVVPLQLLAYHIANLKGRNIDQPRNLAKSVTVE